jgi:hypothetical protein
MISNGFTAHSSLRNSVWVRVMGSAVLVVLSACMSLPSNVKTPTPTTLMGILPPGGSATEISTKSANADLAKQGDACGLISKPEAEAVLGQTVTAVTPGVDNDNTFGGTLYFCTFLGKGLAVVVSRVDLGSAQAAVQSMNLALAKMTADPTSKTTLQPSGPGDKTYWSTSEHAAEFTVLKGNMIFSILLGGNIGDPESHKASLKALTEAVASRI